MQYILRSFFYQILLLWIMLLRCQAQPQQLRMQEIADIYYTNGEYEKALEYYTRCYYRHSTDTMVLKKIASCYKFKREYATCEQWHRKLLSVMGQDTFPDYKAAFASILIQTGKYEEARIYFKELSRQSLPDSNYIKLSLASCDSAIFWKNIPERYEVMNLRPVNSEYSDIAPSFYKGGIVFCSSREGVFLEKKQGATGEPYYDLYYTSPGIHDWIKPLNFSTELNTRIHEGPVYFNRDFTDIYLTRTDYTRSGKGHLKLYKSSRKASGWSVPESFMFNDSTYSFMHPCISPNGKLFFFSSDMPGGYGGTDLYVAFQLDSNRWSRPVNLGADINTPYNELYPYFLEEEAAIYFTSNGHPGMGGYDIYSAILDGERWTNTSNLRPPVNSSGDDFSFIIQSSTGNAFFSSNREGGKGKEDIYYIRLK